MIASAARKERLRPVLLANLSSRSLASASTRTVNVVELMTSQPLCSFVYDIARDRPTQPRTTCGVSRLQLAFELVQKTPVGVFGDDLLRVDLMKPTSCRRSA